MKVVTICTSSGGHMNSGKVDYFSAEKRFGSIKGDDGLSYWFHESSVKNEYIPKQGDPVSFETKRGFDRKKNKETINAINIAQIIPDASEESSVLVVPININTKPFKFTAREQKRINGELLKGRLTNFHDRLDQTCYDIAFEVDWTALTPIAANPCSDPDPDADTTCPKNSDKQYQGYDNRWLMIDGKLALSTFTVKGAVANGFADIMGSCYRVNNRTIKHAEAKDPKKFNYIGEWKRYRVKNSKPGLLRKINYSPGMNEGEVEIEPVVEYYYDFEDDKPIRSLGLKQGDFCLATCDDTNRHKKKVLSIRAIGNKRQGNEVELIYHGEYKFGMDLTLRKGELGKRHYHRFYSLSGKTVEGKVNVLNLKSDHVQEENVYMGVFDRLNKTLDNTPLRSALDRKFWHQDLTGLDPSADKYIWVYYQTFKDAHGKDRVAAIGKNFLFKTAFLHSDAVPSEQDACKDLLGVCPRCAMFGLIDKSADEMRKAIGFRGRFKSSVLVNNRSLRMELFKTEIPVKTTPEDTYVPKTVPLHKWSDEKGEIARQILLPIQGQPKDSKRDVENGYFDHKTGMIQGSKDYLHFELDMQTLLDFISRVNNYRTLRDVYGNDTPQPLINTSYNHELRNYAQVCKDGEIFSGTLGVENCTANEAAALVMLLEHDMADHGFKIGLGKSFGLGSLTSSIKGVWIRKADDYQKWQRMELPDVLAQFHDVNAALERLKEVQHKEVQRKLNSTKGMETRMPWFNPPGSTYY